MREKINLDPFYWRREFGDQTQFLNQLEQIETAYRSLAEDQLTNMKIVIGASTIFEKLRELKSQLFELKFGYDMEKINIVE